MARKEERDGDFKVDLHLLPASRKTLPSVRSNLAGYMAASYSLPSSCCGVGRLSTLAPKVPKRLRAQSFREEDSRRDPVNHESSEGLSEKELWRSTVDENMDVLRCRIEMVRVQERQLIGRSQGHARGWCPPYYRPLEHINPKSLRGDGPSAVGSLEVAELVILSFALPVLGGTLCLCLASLLLHLLAWVV